MAANLDAQTLSFVFGPRPDILSDIQRAAGMCYDAPATSQLLISTCCADSPERVNLFNNIASYVSERLSATAEEEGPASKRRRVDIASQPKGNGHASSQANGVDVASDPVLLEIKDIS